MEELTQEQYIEELERYFKVGDNTLFVDLWYPQHRDIKYVEVGLVDVRATDNIRISYNHERNGWIIEQSSIGSWDADDKVCDADWQEVAFLESWARRKEDEDG